MGEERNVLRVLKAGGGVAGRVNITRRQAFEALLGYHIDLESEHFRALSDGAQDFLKMLLEHVSQINIFPHPSKVGNARNLGGFTIGTLFPV